MQSPILNFEDCVLLSKLYELLRNLTLERQSPLVSWPAKPAQHWSGHDGLTQPRSPAGQCDPVRTDVLQGSEADESYRMVRKPLRFLELMLKDLQNCSQTD